MNKYTLFIIVALISFSCQNAKQNSIQNPKVDKQKENNSTTVAASDYLTSRIDLQDRLKIAVEEKSALISENLITHKIDKKDLNVLFVAYKDADELHIYGKNKDEETYTKVKSYPICRRSGVLGPKKVEGDKQVPEGFYHINRFNPKSLYYLSLGLNYPNELDKSLGYTGSDIFIHGKCLTIGCLPMTDEGIKEIYLYALWAKEAGQKNIPVYIFPFEMTDANINTYSGKMDQKTLDFWKNIQEGYKLFHTNHKELQYIANNGKYTFNR